MKVAVLQSNYVPWKGYFDLIHDVDIFVFYDIVKYTKNDWRNRNMIYSKNGKQWLTIPISSNATKLRIDEVIIEDDSWQKLHVKTLSLAYSRAPYYKQLQEFMEFAYELQNWRSLSELNQALIRWICQKIGIETHFANSESIGQEEDKIERLIRTIKSFDATEYVSGLAAQQYLEGREQIFIDNNIKLSYKQYPIYKSYPQLLKPFEQNVSILDTIANVNWKEIGGYIWMDDTKK